MKKILMLTAAVFAIQTLPAMAQDGAPPKDGKRPDFFAMFDTNGDGQISEAEHLAHAKERFKEIDANGDGVVTREESKAHHDAKRAEMKKKHAERKAKKDAEKSATE